MTHVIEFMFRPNLGSTSFQTKVEQSLVGSMEEAKAGDLLRLSKAMMGSVGGVAYKIKVPEVEEDLYTALALLIPDMTIRQLETTFWTVTQAPSATTEIPLGGTDRFSEDNLAAKPHATMLLKTLLREVR